VDELEWLISDPLVPLDRRVQDADLLLPTEDL
jgi:hypothetical protein